MHIMEKGSQRYVLDPQTGKLVKFDPLLHDRSAVFGRAENPHRCLYPQGQPGCPVDGETGKGRP